MGYGKILVTLDGSPLAERALNQIARIAIPEAWVHLLSVFTEDRATDMAAVSAAMVQTGALDDRTWRAAFEVTSQEKEERERYLRATAGKLGKAGFYVTCEVQQGNAVSSIVQVAKGGFDVIVIATHSRTRLGRVFFGSVAEGVLHHAPCPILIVPNSAASAE